MMYSSLIAVWVEAIQTAAESASKEKEKNKHKQNHIITAGIESREQRMIDLGQITKFSAMEYMYLTVEDAMLVKYFWPKE